MCDFAENAETIRSSLGLLETAKPMTGADDNQLFIRKS